MDCPSTDRGIRVATGAAIYYSRPGLRLWRCLSAPSPSDGHTRSADRATITLAERMCGEAYRIDPAGLPRPCRCVWRAAPSPFAQVISKILQRSSHTLVIAQGCTDPPRRPDRRSHVGRADFGRTAPPIYTSMSFRQAHRMFVRESIDLGG